MKKYVCYYIDLLVAKIIFGYAFYVVNMKQSHVLKVQKYLESQNIFWIIKMILDKAHLFSFKLAMYGSLDIYTTLPNLPPITHTHKTILLLTIHGELKFSGYKNAK